MAFYLVNNSGKPVPVTHTNLGSDVFDYIQPGEMFLWTGGFGDGSADTQTILFWRNYKEVTGWLTGYSGTAAMTKIKELGKTRAVIEGHDCGVFDVRETVKLYNQSGEFVGNVVAGSFVAVDGGTAGADHPERIFCDYCGDLKSVFMPLGASDKRKITNAYIKGVLG